MIESIRGLLDQIAVLDKTLRASKTQQVWSKTIKSEALSIVDSYFRNIRPTLYSQLSKHVSFDDLDSSMQTLLEASHKSISPTNFRSILKETTTRLREVESTYLTAMPVKEHADYSSSIDNTIIVTLDKLLPSAGLSYKQAIRDLNGSDRYSWRGPAVDLRESLRETLDFLAPDDEVKSQPGYKQEPDARGPTMKQKMKFILSKRGVTKNSIDAPGDAVSAIDEILASFVRSVYSRSSIATHTPSNRNEVLKLLAFVRLALSELLEIPLIG